MVVIHQIKFSTNQMKNILIIGTGSIALQHYRNLIKLEKKNQMKFNFFFIQNQFQEGKILKKNLDYKIKHLEEKREFKTINFLG